MVVVGSLSPAGSLSDVSSISGEREEGEEGEEKKEDRQTGTGMRRSLDQMLYCIINDYTKISSNQINYMTVVFVLQMIRMMPVAV